MQIQQGIETLRTTAPSLINTIGMGLPRPNTTSTTTGNNPTSTTNTTTPSTTSTTTTNTTSSAAFSEVSNIYIKGYNFIQV